MSELVRPTVSVVLDYASRFRDEPNTGQFDLALRKLIAQFPYNVDLSDVCLKVAAINALYATNIYAIFDVALHIRNLQVDPRLMGGDLTLVHDVADVRIKGKRRYNYSFASKYCVWHNPDVYAMYDSFVEKLLWHYQLKEQFFPQDIKRSELWADYPRFMAFLHAFRTHFGLQEVTLREVDNFLWLYSRDLSNLSG